MIRNSAVLVSLMFAGAALMACPASQDDRCSGGACVPGGNTGDGGDIDATAPDAAVPPDCVDEADASAPVAKACMDDDFAFFVDAAGGKDTNDGTKAKPLKSIGAAVTLVPTKGKRRIYICGAGPYPEHLKLTTAVNLFGGFACADWAYDGKKAKVAPTDGGYALHVDGVSAPTRFSDLEFVAADVAEKKDGSHSIAGFINESNVKVLRTAFAGGLAADGATGKPGDTGTVMTVSSGATNADGNAAAGAVGAMAKTCTCSTSTETTRGGAGGTNSLVGGVGLPSYGASAPNNGAAGFGATACGSSGSGAQGANAPAVGDAASVAAVGALGPEGWTASKGNDATENGKPGQGGGGGGSFNDSNGGGGGGCGGCGGSAGKGGGGGGASIALSLNESTVTIASSSMTAKQAGDGGSGGAGGPGSIGGSPGAGVCTGGAGGRGADGGAGSGGTGGVSIGILFNGTPPVVDAETTAAIRIGTPGEKGPGGKAGVNDGKPGIAEKLKDAATL